MYDDINCYDPLSASSKKNPTIDFPPWRDERKERKRVNERKREREGGEKIEEGENERLNRQMHIPLF